MNLKADVDAVLGKRHDNGGDYWATADGRLAVGSPFSTIETLQVLHELGVGQKHEAVRGALDLLFSAWREDGRYNLAPSGTLFPCHTANAARILCRFGYVDDERVQRSFQHLLENRFDDGGWRCNKAPLGRSPETDLSNPGVTLFALDAFRFKSDLIDASELNEAIDSLLEHWTVRRPLGPCGFGIGTLFMQTEYPFLRYNIFSYVYVLSFYGRARKDKRFQEALEILRSKTDDDGNLIVDRPNRKLASLQSFAKGQPSEPATKRYHEILANLNSA